MNFIQLQDMVRTHLIDLPDEVNSLVPTLVNQAIREAAQFHNFRFMEKVLAAITVTDSHSLDVAKPLLWKEASSEPHLLLATGRTKRLSWLPSRSEALRNYSDSLPQPGNASPKDIGEPQQLLELTTTIEVYPFANALSDWTDGKYRLRIPYWEYPANLVNSSDTNWLTDNADQFIILRAASFGFVLNREEERASVYAGQFNQKGNVQTAFSELARVIALDKRSRLPDRFSISPRRAVFNPVMFRR